MNTESNKPEDTDDGFGLIPPTGELAKRPKGDRPPIEVSQTVSSSPAEGVAGQYKQMGWKGFEQEIEDDDPDVSFLETGQIVEDDLDMTPMVDVTFLLLIFFMVTASFTLQKSIQQPPSQTEDPSTNVVVDEETEDDYVEVIIDQTNTFYVTSRDADEVEAPVIEKCGLDCGTRRVRQMPIA